MSYQWESNSDNESDYNDQDLGREVVEKNIRNRLQRIANHTKDELNKVLKRVDTTLSNYDSSVQSSLIQHGMPTSDMANVEHVADIKELEELLNDSLAKQRYKQRLMIFIVGQTEQVSEKAKLLQQVGQFFNEQTQNFGGSEFHAHDDAPDDQDEVDLTLKSFDVKDCYVHVKTLGTRLNELNEEIIQYLIQNAGTKQQAKGKKKLAQVAKETREQLASLQSKLETANREMLNRDNKIESLEKDIETLTNETKTAKEKIEGYQTEIESSKVRINQLEADIEQYKFQVEDLIKSTPQLEAETTSDPNQAEEINDTPQINTEQIHLITPSDQEIPTSGNLDVLLESPDLNTISPESLPTAYTDLQKQATTRIGELLKELEIKESNHNQIVQKLQEDFFQYKKMWEREGEELIAKAESAYELQIKAQTAAEEAIQHLQSYMAEQDKPVLINRETQTDVVEEPIRAIPEEVSLPIFEEALPPPEEIVPPPPSEEVLAPLPMEEVNSFEEISATDQLSSISKAPSETLESIENFRVISSKDKYVSLIEEKRQELDRLKVQADSVLSRPTSIKERISLQSLENSLISVRRRASMSSMGSADYKENQRETESIFKQDQEQQTSFVSSRRSSIHKEINAKGMVEIDHYKLPFFHLYELIYKFRQSIINLLEKNQFEALANCLQMIRQLSVDEQNTQTSNFTENIEHVLKDITKILQTCLTTFQSKINELQKKEKELKPIPELIPKRTVEVDQQSALVEEKESTIKELTTKYEYLTNILEQTNVKHETEIKQNDKLMQDQQKLVQSLQQQITHLQKRLTKMENEGVIEPSILFTRLDAERNEQTLQQALQRGKVPETTYYELNETMTDYISLPSQQLSNLVKRYIQLRKATEVEDRIQSEIFDNDTKSVLEKIESLYGRRSAQMRKYMSELRQQRVNLAKTLTEKFDHLEDESSIFLIRPIYSYQGRAAAQSYMQQEKHRREVLLKQTLNRKKHHTSRQSAETATENNQQIFAPLTSMSGSDDEERLFHIDRTLPSRNEQSNDLKQIPRRFAGLTRLQELDIQRALMPMSHVTTPLLATFTTGTVDPSVPSLNLRSYVALSRPGAGSVRTEQPPEIVHNVSREGFSALSRKTQPSSPHTPHNSSAGGLRRTGAPLPPIRRTIPSSISPLLNDRRMPDYIPTSD